jgi:hypothetical protein
VFARGGGLLPAGGRAGVCVLATGGSVPVPAGGVVVSGGVVVPGGVVPGGVVVAGGVVVPGGVVTGGVVGGDG